MLRHARQYCALCPQTPRWPRTPPGRAPRSLRAVPGPDDNPFPDRLPRNGSAGARSVTGIGPPPSRCAVRSRSRSGCASPAAVFLVLLTLLVPGSAQLAAGNRAVGRVVLRVWLGVAALVVLTAALWLANRTIVLHLATSPLLLMLMAVALFVAAFVWPVLVVDAWRLGRPMLLPRARPAGDDRAAGRLAAAHHRAGVRGGPPALGGLGPAGQRLRRRRRIGRGGRALQRAARWAGTPRPDRSGTRPDSLTLASIDSTTGRTVLFALPRNLENVRFPEGSSGAQAMPGGGPAATSACSTVCTPGARRIPRRFPGAPDPGAEAMKQAVEGITGLKVNYYVLVDLLGFRSLIDAMGGIDLTVRERVPIGGGTSRVSGYIEPGTQHLDGYHALWYARSRHGASDYARMARQRCVMNAMVQQMDPATLLSKFQGIAAAAQDVMSTDLPAGELATFIDLGTKGKTQKITSVAFVPPLVEPAYPDFPRSRTG